MSCPVCLYDQQSDFLIFLFTAADFAQFSVICFGNDTACMSD